MNFRGLKPRCIRIQIFIHSIGNNDDDNVKNGDIPFNNVHKSVRFKDTPDDNDASELMGTRHVFKPYKDDPDEQESSEELSNHQMFAQHQQTMMRQDQDLDTLHQLISRQFSMGQDINQELDDQLIILNDLGTRCRSIIKSIRSC